MEIKYIIIVISVIIVSVLYYCFLKKTLKISFEETFENTTIGADDLSSIKNLGTIAKGLLEGGLTVPGNMKITGDLNLTGKSTLTGDSTVGGDSIVSGNSTIKGNSAITGNSVITGNSNVSGNSAITGNSTIAGDLTVAKNNIVFGHNIIHKNNTVHGFSYDSLDKTMLINWGTLNCMNSSNGTNVDSQTCDRNNENMYWVIRKGKLFHPASGKCMTVPASNPGANGNPLSLETCDYKNPRQSMMYTDYKHKFVIRDFNAFNNSGFEQHIRGYAPGKSLDTYGGDCGADCVWILK